MFTKIDNAISEELKKLSPLIEKLEFGNDGAIEFELNDSVGPICNNHRYEGIYFFEVKMPISKNEEKKPIESLNEFVSLWKDPAYHMRWTPGIKQSRLVAHQQMVPDGWVPLYIGKSRNVGKRVNDHITMDLEKTVFAMKLKARKNLYAHMFRVRFIKIDVIHYDMIVPYVERELRNRLNPIAGKQ